MTTRQALSFVRKHGIVLESARGPVPTLTEAIVGVPVRGSWWGHPRSHDIWAVTRALRDSDQILVCRLVNGKITYVHRRLWPALVRAGDRLPRRHLAQVRELHTPAGHHITKETPFPDWVPASVTAEARRLSETAALRRLHPVHPG